MTSYSAQVDKQVADTKALMIAVRRESIERHIEIMQEPGPSKAMSAAAVAAGAGLGKVKKDGSRGVSKRALGPIPSPGGGGRLPVATGFLRASLKVAIGQANFSIEQAPEGGGSHSYDPATVTLAISNAEIDDPVEAVYTAAYARRIEYGFSGSDSLGRNYSQAGTRWVGLAAQRWIQTVESVVAEVKARKGR